ncbi:MAG: phosphatidylinositol-specific phospholipase C domain-containing protein, partial [Oscillospiraceae bacterium]|nr:phosphatidylinositol-specific phospholipase C domain-containing protein [Oscillospiraceae bacterium]
MKTKRGIVRILLHTVFVLLSLLFIMAAVLLIIPLTERPDRMEVSGSSDWMAALSDELDLGEIIIPGSHDSATQYVQLAFFSKCQSLGIGEQLSAGCRYLDIRLGFDGKTGKLKLMHGFTECRNTLFATEPLYMEDMLRECYAFLAAHPTETVIIAVKQEHGEESVEQFETALDAYLLEHPDYWLLTDTVPSLGEARGKLVLMRRYEDEAGLGPRAGIPLCWPNQNGYDDTSLHTVRVDQGSYVLWVQDRYEYGTDNKWSAFCTGMETADSASDTVGRTISLNFLSTKGTAAYGHPFSFAKKLNSMLMDRTPLSGWIVLDFFSATLAEHV